MPTLATLAALRRWCLPPLLVVVSGSAGWAQTSAPGSNIASPTLAWAVVAGTAEHLSIGSDGAVFALDADGLVWLRRPKDEASASAPNWVKLPGQFARIAAQTVRSAWAIDANGEAYQYNGTWWRPMAGAFSTELQDIAVSARGTVYGLGRNGAVLVYAPQGTAPSEPPSAAPAGLIRLEVDDQDRLWGLRSDGSVLHREPKEWVTVPNLVATTLSVKGFSTGGAWFLDREEQLLWLAPNGNTLRKLPVRAMDIASTVQGSPWLLQADRKIYASDNGLTPAKPTKAVPKEQVFTQLLNWRQVPGNAMQLAISSKGAIVALGKEGELWNWKARNDWGRLPGSFRQVAIDANGAVWGVDANAKLLRYQGSFWIDVRNDVALLAMAPDGTPWTVDASGSFWRWDARTRTWAAGVPDSKPKASPKAFAIAPDGRPWQLNPKGQPLRWTGDKWEALPDIEAVDIGIGPEGTVWITGQDKALYRWDPQRKFWEKLNGDAHSVAVGPGGVPWVTTANGNIRAAGFFDDLPQSRPDLRSAATVNAEKVVSTLLSSQGVQAIASGTPGGGGPGGAASTPQPLAFQKLTGAARDIAIGADGSVFTIGFDGILARWSNARNSFVTQSGQFASIAVAPDGKPWGLTQRGEVYRFDGAIWQLINNFVGSDLTISGTGVVMAVGPQNMVYQYSAGNNRFERLTPPSDELGTPIAQRIALDPQGKLWTLQSDGTVSSCEKWICTRLPLQARDIAAGPDGTVAVVDSDRTLRVWNSKTLGFERVITLAGPLLGLAVGPSGKPWVINGAQEVWSSGFFARNEQNDLAQSNVTPASSSTSGTGFTFTQTMVFDQVPLKEFNVTLDVYTSFMAFSTKAKPLLYVLFPNNNEGFWQYDASAKNFTKYAAGLPPAANAQNQLDGIGYAADGRLWAWSAEVRAAAGAVSVLEGGNWQTMPGIPGLGAGDPMNPMDMAFGTDGSVLAISPANPANLNNSEIFKFNTVGKQFEKTALQFSGKERALEVDAVGALWLITSDTQKVYQYVNNAFVERPLPQGMTPCWSVTQTCISASSSGTIYMVGNQSPKTPNHQLLRWNAASQQWDRITTTFTTRHVWTEPDGRPWVSDGNRIYRAR